MYAFDTGPLRKLAFTQSDQGHEKNKETVNINSYMS